MKILDKFLILYCFGLGACLAQGTTPATTPDNVYDKTPVNFSFKSTDKNYLTFDKVLPFDKKFIIHFTSIQETVTNIKVTITRTNTNKFVHLQSGTYTDESLVANTYTYLPEQWKRPPGVTGEVSGDVEIKIPLLPNVSYSVGIEPGFTTSIGDSEALSLTRAIASANPVIDAVNLFARTALISSVGASQNLTNEKEQIVTLLEKAVTDFNSTYTLKPINSLAATEDVKKLDNDLHYMFTELNGLISHLKDASFSSELKEASELKIKMLTAINWGTIDVGSTDYKSLNSVITGIDKVVTGAKTMNNTAHNYIKAFLANLKLIPDDKTALINYFVSDVAVANTTVYNSLGDTYVDDFTKNAKLYISLDIGYAYVMRIDRGLAYSGVNLYFRPIDKSIPLSQYNTFHDWLSVRSSLLIGVSLGSVAEKNVRKGFLGDQALIIGAGLKLNSFLKVNSGCFVHYRYDENPALDRYHTSLSPFVSFSVDLDAKSLFSGIGDSIFK